MRKVRHVIHRSGPAFSFCQMDCDFVEQQPLEKYRETQRESLLFLPSVREGVDRLAMTNCVRDGQGLEDSSRI